MAKVLKEYFRHDYGARNDKKFIPMYRKHKLRGLGAYWCLVEMLYENGGYLLLSDLKEFAFNLRERESFLKSIVTEFDLFQHDSQKFWSESVLNRLGTRIEKSEKARESINKRWGKDTNVLRPEIKRNTNNSNSNSNKREYIFRLREKNISISFKEFFEENFQIMLDRWKGVNPDLIYQQLEKDYPGYMFNDLNHLQNTFRSIAEKLSKPQQDQQQSQRFKTGNQEQVKQRFR